METINITIDNVKLVCKVISEKWFDFAAGDWAERKELHSCHTTNGFKLDLTDADTDHILKELRKYGVEL